MLSFDIDIVEKPSPVSTPSSSLSPTCAASSTASQPPSRHDYAGLIDLLSSMPDEAFFPYPPCSLRQLQQIDTFFVAYDNRSATSPPPSAQVCEEAIDGSAEVSSLRAAKLEAKGAVCGLVGIVWVRLGGSPSGKPGHTTSRASALSSSPVEGYLQVVLVPRPYRRNGVAKRLLDACLSAYAHGDAEGGSQEPVRPSPIVPEAAAYERRLVHRWRLHTMSPTAATLRCLQTHFYPELDAAEGASHTKPSPLRLPPPPPVCGLSSTAPATAWEAVCVTLTSTMNAVTRLYENQGFAVRRHLPRYYAAEADAVEMVRTVKSAVRSVPLSAPPPSIPPTGHKRSRSGTE